MARASVRGQEHAWPVADIPAVINALEAAGLVNVGGQLQLRIPEGATCECHWIEVDTSSVGSDLHRADRVAVTAIAAHEQFETLCRDYEFVAEVRSAFPEQVRSFEDAGGDISAHLCFVWYGKAAE
jgi:hypothetical protein